MYPKWAFFLPVLLLSLLACKTQKQAITNETAPPNVVLIFIDDMGYGDLSCFGNTSIQTPHIDALADKGLRLTQFYVNSPICSPSRVAITSGQYPARYQVHGHFASRAENRKRSMPDFLPATAPSLARVLKKNGYTTGHFGKWHMGGGRDVDDAPHPSAYGFDRSLVSFEGLGNRILEPGDNALQKSSAALGQGHITYASKYERTGMYVDSALAFIELNSNQPFYVNLWPNDVHDRHIPEPGTTEKFEAVTENPYERDFFAVLEGMDQQIGRFLNELDRLGLMDNTLIIFTSDNGPTDWPRYYNRARYPENYSGKLYAPGSTGGFHGRKWSLYEGGIRMPFIAYWKDRIQAGETDEHTIASAVDLFPTICQLTGIELPAGYQPDGNDISTALLGKPQLGEKPIFWYYPNWLKPGNPDYLAPELAVRTGPWKLLVEVDGTNEQLYNLSKDPYETTNLNQQEPALRDSLRELALDWFTALPK